MAEEVIGLLFGVEGVGINGASGQEIVKGLTKIVDEINSGKSNVPKIKFNFDTTEATKAVTDLKKQLKDIEKIASIKVTYSNSGQSKTIAKGLQADLKNVEEATTASAKAKQQDSKSTESQRKAYSKLKEVIRDYSKALKESTKLSKEYSYISQNETTKILTDTRTQTQMDLFKDLNGYEAPNFKDRIESINAAVEAFKELDTITIKFNENNVLDRPNEQECQEYAERFGITVEQVKELMAKLEKARRTNAANVETINKKEQDSWTDYASKVRDEIERLRGTISKDLKASKMADEIIKMASESTGSVGDLKDKFDEFRNAIHKSGADIETWGDRFKKSFANNIRSALVAAITAKITQSIHQIYTNVVNLDKSMTNLQIASGKTRSEIQKLTKEYAGLAKQLGATTAEVADAADTWLRQGYSIEEANTLIANSTMLSKLGQMEATDASTALTSAMKGYGVAVEDSVKIVDKLTKVDMEAAASAGDIATAMAETATSARLSGVSMDKLIGYITTVKEVTQDGSESVGVFFKSLFARMNNISAGKFVDYETGEALNDVETVLNKLGIDLKSTNDEFRNTSDVLDEVASRWNEFNDTERNAIATAMAGSRNLEKFSVLMENYGDATKYAEAATDSAGTAVEKFSAYTDSIEGKMNSLTATFEELSMTVLNGNLISGIVTFLAGIVEFLNKIASVGDGVLVTIPAITIALAALYTMLVSIKKSAAFDTMLTTLKSMLAVFPAIIAQVKAWILATKAKKLADVEETVAINAKTAAIEAANAAQTAMNATNPVGWIGLAVTAIYALVAGLGSLNNAQDKARQKAKEASAEAATLSDEISELTYKYLELSDAVQTDDAAKESLLQTQDELLKKLELEKSEIKGLIEEYGSYEEAMKNASLEQLKTEERDLRGGLSANTNDLLYEARDKTFNALMHIEATHTAGTFNLSPDRENYDAYHALKALEDAGYITSDNYSTHTDGYGKKYSLGLGVYFRYKYNNLQTTEDILQAYNDLGGMLDIVNDTAGSDNFVYEALYKQYSSMSECVDAYKTSVDNLNDNLAQQYAISALIGREIPKTKEEFEAYRQEVINNAISNGEFIGTSKDVADVIDSVLSKQSSFTSFYNVAENTMRRGAIVALKSASDILEEIQDGYDGLASALADVTSEGYLTTDALSTLYELESEGKLAGLKLEEILTRDAKGYKIAEDSLQNYIQALIEQYTITENFESLQDKENATENLKTLRAVLATLSQTQEVYRKELEKQQDVYEEQLDAYGELIDLRKDLLQTYEEELSYQKELAKRQQNVATLQTKLSVARLDQSAAGQARVRELEAELKEAQEDLDDFTLEHAVDVLTNQLESQHSEYETLIKNKLDVITSLLKELKPDDVDISKNEDAIKNTETAKEKAFNDAQDYITSHGLLEKDKAFWGQDQTFSLLLQEYLNTGGSIADLKGDVNTEGITKEDAKKAAQDYINSHGMLEVDKNRWGQDSNFSSLLKTYYALGGSLDDLIGKKRAYHSGGIVGDTISLSSTEEFAKLLKGEFVSTPAQMKRFMEETLPQIANYSATGGTNEFNAPLIEITCESVTTEALPELERVVNEAVKEIQKQLDSGMSRTGFKRPQTKRLT